MYQKLLQQGRKKPYTEKGIKKIPCFCCGGKSNQQWQICSLDNKYYAICNQCDIELNNLVLMFFRYLPETRRHILTRYKKKKAKL